MVPSAGASRVTFPTTPPVTEIMSIPGKTIETLGPAIGPVAGGGGGIVRLFLSVTLTVSPWFTISVGPGNCGTFGSGKVQVAHR